MRKTLVWVGACALMCGSVWADVCTDLKTQYSSLILRLQQETQSALSQTTDPAEQTAIRESYDAQLAALQAEEASALASSGCGTTTGPGTTTPPPTTGGTDPGTTPPPTTGGTDPGTGGVGTPGDGNNQTCTDLMDQIRTEAKTIAATKGRGAAATFVRSKKPEIEAVCGNYGRGRCQVGGVGNGDHDRGDRDDDKKCDRDDHDRAPAPKCDPQPKCDPKPQCDTHKKWDR